MFESLSIVVEPQINGKPVNDFKTFVNVEIGEVRVFLCDGDLWFNAKDVCQILGLNNVSEALRGLNEDQKATISNVIPHEMPVISEPGIYSLIIRSRKPEAKAFKRWIGKDVIPFIRKAGGC